MFSHTPQQLQELVSYLLSEAKALGATNAAVMDFHVNLSEGEFIRQLQFRDLERLAAFNEDGGFHR